MLVGLFISVFQEFLSHYTVMCNGASSL